MDEYTRWLLSQLNLAVNPRSVDERGRRWTQRGVPGFLRGMVENAQRHPVSAGLDMTPVVGDVKALGYDAPRAFAAGDTGMGLLALASILPGVPGLGRGGFDEWRASIWDDVKRGTFHPEEVVPSNADILSGAKALTRLYRAMSDAEWDAAQAHGVFRPLREGDPDLYVTPDPDRLSGGAYGARGGGRIVEFDPVPVHRATGRLIDVDEIATNEIPTSHVRRVWAWDADAGDHILAYERPAVPEIVPEGAGLTALSESMPGPRRVANPIRAYHGSPHDFDRFDISKIGTGEGAQAYGHGLYFAENQGVADTYRHALSQREIDVPGGERYRPANTMADRSDPRAKAYQYLTVAHDAQSSNPYAYARSALRNIEPDNAVAKDALRVLDEWQEAGATVVGGGRSYEVAIHARPEEFLDWDAPLSQQSESVRQGVRGLLGKDWDQAVANYPDLATGDIPFGWAQLPGEGIYGAAVERSRIRGGGEKALREAGIPGIRYLDQGSRQVYDDTMRGVQRAGQKVARLESELAANPSEALANRLSDARQELESAQRGVGDITHNYVVFNDELIEILRKYGLAGLLATNLVQRNSQREDRPRLGMSQGVF